MEPHLMMLLTDFLKTRFSQSVTAAHYSWMHVPSHADYTGPTIEQIDFLFRLQIQNTILDYKTDYNFSLTPVQNCSNWVSWRTVLLAWLSGKHILLFTMSCDIRVYLMLIEFAYCQKYDYFNQCLKLPLETLIQKWRYFVKYII